MEPNSYFRTGDLLGLSISVAWKLLSNHTQAGVWAQAGSCCSRGIYFTSSSHLPLGPCATGTVCEEGRDYCGRGYLPIGWRGEALACLHSRDLLQTLFLNFDLLCFHLLFPHVRLPQTSWPPPISWQNLKGQSVVSAEMPGERGEGEWCFNGVYMICLFPEI